MNKQRVFMLYSDEGKVLYQCLPRRIDVLNSHSVIFSYTKIFTIPFNVASINIESGMITIYYLNNSYATISSK